MIFAVIPIHTDQGEVENIGKKLKNLDIPVYDNTAPDVFFVSFSGNSGDLSDEIGFGDDESVGRGVVLRVSHRSGYAPGSLWEWIDNNE